MHTKTKHGAGVGDLLKRSRDNSGRTMREVATRLGKSVSFVNNVESGYTKLPPDLVQPWATAVGIPNEKLLGTLLYQESEEIKKKAGIHS
jgi:transcriptional regulator with XRE-family HTH domain